MDLPHQTEISVENLTFFSNFDSGNLSRAIRSGPNQYEVWISPDASHKGYSCYRVWFHFGIRGLKKDASLKLTIMNMSNFRLFSNPIYRPVWRSLPSQPEWQRINSDPTFERNFATTYKLSWSFDLSQADNELYFALVQPYPLVRVTEMVNFMEQNCPKDAVFHREVITRSIDRRDVELLTISNEANFLSEPEDQIPNLFPSNAKRPNRANKPIIFISARVHPGETPASYVLEGLLRTILGSDRRGYLLRKYFVFKVIPVLNPDGVVRGHYRVDQNGVNLNRCYISPSLLDHPSIYAARTYFEYLYTSGVCFYLDLHAHASRRGCFLFGNYLEDENSVHTQLFAKLLSVNSGYFDWEENDFSEKSMTAKDSNDHHSKEGSGRVALYKSTGIVCSYTVECAYYVPKPLHHISSLVSVRSGKKYLETVGPLVNPKAIQVHNRKFFDSIGSALAHSLLDYYGVNVVSRVPSSVYRTLEGLRDFIIEYNKSNKRAIMKKSSRNTIPRVLNAQRPLSKVLSAKNESEKGTVKRLRSIQGKRSRARTIITKY